MVLVIKQKQNLILSLLLVLIVMNYINIEGATLRTTKVKNNNQLYLAKQKAKDKANENCFYDLVS